MLTRDSRIQQDDPLALVVDHLVDKASRAKVFRAENVDERVTIVVVADGDMYWNFQYIQTRLEAVIGFNLSQIRKIACKHTEIGVAVSGIDGLNPCLQPGRRIQTVRQRAFLDQVQVAQDNEFEHINDPIQQQPKKPLMQGYTLCRAVRV